MPKFLLVASIWDVINDASTTTPLDTVIIASLLAIIVFLFKSVTSTDERLAELNNSRLSLEMQGKLINDLKTLDSNRLQSWIIYLGQKMAEETNATVIQQGFIPIARLYKNKEYPARSHLFCAAVNSLMYESGTKAIAATDIQALFGPPDRKSKLLSPSIYVYDITNNPPYLQHARISNDRHSNIVLRCAFINHKH